MPPHLQRPTPLWKFPITLTLIGLAVMVGGWTLSTWRPPMGDRLGQIRDMSDDPELTLRIERPAPMPPFEMPGRLIFFGGVALFLVGVVRMYRAPAGPPRDEEPEPDEAHEESGEAIPR